MIDHVSGSERRPRALTGDTLKEASCVQKSLNGLTNLLAKLSSGQEVMSFEFRECRLTQLLMECLQPTCSAGVVAALSPSALFEEETMSTLRFAQRTAGCAKRAAANSAK